MSSLVNQTVRRLRRPLYTRLPLDGDPIARVSRHFAQARWLVKTYYLMSIFICASLFYTNRGLASSSEDWDFLWPLAWVERFDVPTAIGWLTVACFLASLAAFQFDGNRLARIAFAALFLPAAAVTNSLGGINHPYHAWFWIGACFILLPDIRREPVSRHIKMSYLTVIVAAQALILLFYSMAGFWKALYGVAALASGVEGNFSPRGFALTLANRVLQTGTSPLMADPLIDHFWLAWPLFLGLIYIQLVAVAVAFRPRLHVAWGYLLIGFHLGTWLLMEIIFVQHVALLALLLVLSPFRPARWSLTEAAADLPIFGRLVRRILVGAPARRPLEA